MMDENLGQKFTESSASRSPALGSQELVSLSTPTPVEHKGASDHLLSLASPVVNDVTILRLSLAEFTAKRAYAANFVTSDLRVSIPLAKVRVARQEELTNFAVLVTFSLEGTQKNDPEKRVLFEMSATFAVIYQVKNVSEFSEDSLNAFGKTSGVFNAWPYWREFVQSAAARLGLPTLMVPVYRF